MVFGLRINNKEYLLIALIYLMTNAILYSNKIDSEFYQWSKIVVSGDSMSGFTLLSNEETGIQFQNDLPQAKSLSNQVYLNGSGVALGDINNDGLCDIYLCRLDGSNHLYLNQGKWRFKEVGGKFGVDCAGMDSTGASFADLDGDNDVDLIVNSVSSETVIYRNDGDRFQQVSAEPEALIIPGGTSIAIADIDGNGLLDFYVTHYRDSTLMDMPNTDFNFRNIKGRREIYSVNGTKVKGSKFENRFRINSKGGIEENGLPDVLYYNMGGMKFTKSLVDGNRFQDSRGVPLKNIPYEWGLAVMFRDINRDGLPDLFVCNDFDTEDRLWLNIGKGRFREAPSYGLRKTSMFSMGVDFADINRDSLDDFVVLDMLNRDRKTRQNQMPPRLIYQPLPGQYLDRPQYMRNTLFLNRGLGVFSEIAFFAGIQASDWSWCPVFLDVDLDGYEDLLITNGVERNARHLDTIIKLKNQRESKKMSKREILFARKIFPSQSTSNMALRNLGNLKFSDYSTNWGFDLKGISHGMACGDLDGDGDLDLVVNNLNWPVSLYRNDIGKPRLMVKLKGPKNNLHGIGARIEISHGDFTQSQEIIGGGRYLSSDDFARVFAMAKGKAKLTITWPDLRQSVINNVEPNRIYLVDYRGSDINKLIKTKSSPIFSLVNSKGLSVHRENIKEATQPLLPKGLNEAGPGIAFGDLDNDGWEDLAISSGRGGEIGLYKNLKGTGLSAFNKSRSSVNTRDGLSLIITDGYLIQSFSNLEDGLQFGDMITIGKPGEDPSQRIKAKTESAGHIALADIDSDGDLDLFIAGRSIPNHYPKPADSWIYINDEGIFTENKVWSEAFKGVGITSGAVFAPINSDSMPDLILACEWASPKVFINNGEGFEDKTKFYGLNHFKGLWCGVDVGDFDANGSVDFVVTNRGLNSSYRASIERPIVVYHGDLNEDGVWDFIETEYGKDNKLYPRRSASAFASAMPWLTDRFSSYNHYSNMNVTELFGSSLIEKMNKLELTTLESMVFIQKGNRFIARPLPIEAQFSSAYGPAVADFNNDGLLDMAISQNQFNLSMEQSRDDAGLGLILIGVGDGQFKALDIKESGFVVPGEGRATAVSDFNHDGLMDIIVGQNGNLPRLFKNQSKRRGLRIVLKGDPGNVKGVGAAMRLDYNGQVGCVHVVRLGSGYLSQNSTTQIIGNSETASGLLVNWPSENGKQNKIEYFKLAPLQTEVIAEKGKGAVWPSFN